MNKQERILSLLDRLIKIKGFEPLTPASQKQCSTKLSYILLKLDVF
ncbi:MAG: hypothetical protein [Bacteriophage sp.]|nr:MAG: hypothetical protein [Bacteriophage sp.]